MVMVTMGIMATTLHLVIIDDLATCKSCLYAGNSYDRYGNRYDGEVASDSILLSSSGQMTMPSAWVGGSLLLNIQCRRVLNGWCMGKGRRASDHCCSM